MEVVQTVRRLLYLIWALAVILVIGVLAGFFVVYTGAYNVSARYSDRPVVATMFDTTMTRSVERNAAGIRAPNLDDPDIVRRGFSHYQGTCAQCHGAPGVPIGDIGKGLRPDPPELMDTADDWKPNELFWLTKNGIRMTGMPAWGPTHSDAALWSIVAFVRKLPAMKPAEYRALQRQVPPAMMK